MLLIEPVPSSTRWFARSGCVIERGDHKDVFLGGTLIASFEPADTAVRNAILIALSSDPSIHLGRLVDAFGISRAGLHKIRQLFEAEGLEAVVARGPRGRPTKRTASIKRRLDSLFAKGLTVDEVHGALKAKLGRSTVGRARASWAQARTHEAQTVSMSAKSVESTSTLGAGVEALPMFPALPEARRPVRVFDASHSESGSERVAMSADEAKSAPNAPKEETESPVTCGHGHNEAAPNETQPMARAVGFFSEDANRLRLGIGSSGDARGRSAADDDRDPGDRAALIAAQATPTPAAVAPAFEPQASVAVEPSVDDPEPGDRAPESAREVQHLGVWLMIATVAGMGLHVHALARAAKRRLKSGAIRLALDALIAGLSCGERCVEGVRRIATPTAHLLLRARRAPSPTWVRRTLGLLATEGAGAMLHYDMACEYLQATKTTNAMRKASGPIVFYIDNHLRPYAGQKLVRKGWRMQDKRALPGVTDYYVHDQDGRPVLRVDAPAHDSLTDWLTPIAGFLREALGPEEEILLAFDRAGAFPEQMAELRDDGFQFVTYERAPYPLLAKSAFVDSFLYGTEKVPFSENRQTNLGKGRGRVRRIAFRSSDRQVNILAISSLPPKDLHAIVRGRWSQENGFKHGVERWGINQLDGRRTEPYAPDTIIPDPARRRLDFALQIARAREGQARRELARLKPGASRRGKWEAELAHALADQRELESIRPMLPTHAPLAETELAGKLVKHTGEYKALIDAVRVACANAEAELAAILAGHLPRPAEAKKTLANLLLAPGSIQVNASNIVIRLLPAGTKREIQAMVLLAEECNEWRMLMPGDRKRRPIRFEVTLH